MAWVLVTGLSAAVAAGVLTWLRRNLLLVAVNGLSMEPTLRSGDRVLVRRRSADLLAVGDIVLLTPPASPAGAASRRGPHLKRVAALPDDPIPPGIRGPAGERAARVPPGHLVVLSDNPMGTDSRNWGLCPAGGVTGVMLFRTHRAAMGSVPDSTPGVPESTPGC
ncbi:MAG: S26 family signal peptidase [Micromonosporaceae bacterium]|nr:S26 family signal peptidase [Micromonosporaceae bacterium]